MNAPLPFAVPFLRFAEVVHWPLDFCWGPRRFYDHEFVYVLHGAVEMQIGEREFLAPSDALFLIRPREVHRFQTVEKNAHALIGIHFDWTPRADTAHFQTFRPAEEPFEESLFRETQTVPYWDVETTPFLDLRGRPRVRQLLLEVIAAHAMQTEYSGTLAGALLAAAIAQMAHEAALLRDFKAHSYIGADAIRRVHRARELLETSHEQPLSLPQVASEVGWSADHLGRMCREVLGVSPGRIQMQARIRRAQEMLRYGNRDIAAIAHRCGFGDATHFAHAFKRETGITPRQFENQDRCSE